MNNLVRINGTSKTDLPALFLAALALTACDVGLNKNEVETKLAAQVSEHAGGPVEVSCPGKRLKGDVMCTVSAQGTSVEVLVKADVKGRKWNASLSEILPGKAVADGAKSAFAKNYQLHWKNVTCPLISKSALGTKFDCQGTMPDGKTTIPVHVTVQAGEMPLDYKIDSGVIVGAKTVAFITKLLEQNKLSGPVECGKSFFWSMPGSSFTCKTPHGDATVRIKDIAGAVSVSIDKKKTTRKRSISARPTRRSSGRAAIQAADAPAPQRPRARK